MLSEHPSACAPSPLHQHPWRGALLPLCRGWNPHPTPQHPHPPPIVTSCCGFFLPGVWVLIFVLQLENYP